MSRISRLTLALLAISALSINYTALNILAIIWRLDISNYLLLYLVPSFLFAAVIIDLTKTTIYTSTSLFLGVVISVGVLAFPSITLGESETIVLVFTYMSKYFVLSIFPTLAGMILGCFVGDALLNSAEMEYTQTLSK